MLVIECLRTFVVNVLSTSNASYSTVFVGLIGVSGTGLTGMVDESGVYGTGLGIDTVAPDVVADTQALLSDVVAEFVENGHCMSYYHIVPYLSNTLGCKNDLSVHLMYNQ